MTIGTIILFCIAVIGLTNIIADPATIFQPVRDFIANKAETSGAWNWLDKLVSCYQCTGFWIGILCGMVLISFNFFVLVFICGPAGSFIATWGAHYFNYLEAQSV